MAWYKTVVGGGVGYAVAGPVGGLVGVALAGGDSDPGYDMSDVPFGVHVEASFEEDDQGRRWTLSFLSEVPGTAYARLRVLSDDALPLAGKGHFADGSDGHFTVSGPIRKRSCVIYVPFGAATYSSPKNLSLEVSVWKAAEAQGNAPEGAPQAKPRPVGQAVLDADLPKPRPWDPASYLQPLTAACVRILMTDGRVPNEELRKMVERLAAEFECADDADAIAGILKHASAPMSMADAVPIVAFRFPGVRAAGFVELLRAACFDGGTGTRESYRKLEEVAGLLAGHKA